MKLEPLTEKGVPSKKFGGGTLSGGGVMNGNDSCKLVASSRTSSVVGG